MPETTNQAVYQPMTFDAIRIGLASPEKIREWSKGEVKKPESMGPRPAKAEADLVPNWAIAAETSSAELWSMSKSLARCKISPWSFGFRWRLPKRFDAVFTSRPSKERARFFKLNSPAVPIFFLISAREVN